jgi:hypothetical protein
MVTDSNVLPLAWQEIHIVKPKHRITASRHLIKYQRHEDRLHRHRHARRNFHEGGFFFTGIFKEPIRANSVKTLPISGREYFRGRLEAAAKTECGM